MNKLSRNRAHAFITTTRTRARKLHDQIARFFRTGKARCSVLVTALIVFTPWRVEYPIDGGTPFIGVIEWIMQNITLTSIPIQPVPPTSHACGHTVHGLVKHAVIDLHPRDLLSEKVVTGSVLASAARRLLQPKARNNRAAWLGVSTSFAVTVIPSLSPRSIRDCSLASRA